VNAPTDEDLLTSERELIAITFPGSVDFVVIARFTAATVGARAGFDLNEIDDLRLAVDELSISFGPLNGDSCLRYAFVRDGDTVTVRCTREPAPGRMIDGCQGAERDSRQSKRDLVNWQHARQLSVVLLDELVTSHGREISDGRSVAWLMKRRGRDSR
jgi:hypothetical protein